MDVKYIQHLGRPYRLRVKTIPSIKSNPKTTKPGFDPAQKRATKQRIQVRTTGITIPYYIGAPSPRSPSPASPASPGASPSPPTCPRTAASGPHPPSAPHPPRSCPGSSSPPRKASGSRCPPHPTLAAPSVSRRRPVCFQAPRYRYDP